MNSGVRFLPRMGPKRVATLIAQRQENKRFWMATPIFGGIATVHIAELARQLHT